MPTPLTVSLELTGTDLLSPELTRALATIREVQAATAELNGTSPFGTPNVGGEFGGVGASAEVAAQQVAAVGAAGETAGKRVAAGSREATAALKEEGGAMAALHEEYIGGTLEMVAGFAAFESVVGIIERVGEAEREAILAQRSLRTLYGESADAYRTYAEEVSRATNYTPIQVEQGLASLAALRRDYGLTEDEIKGLTEATLNMAAVTGVPVAQAFNDVAASMRGQARAGVELNLNMRSNVIQGMQGLTEAEKAAALGGDSLEGAQARLKVIMIESGYAAGEAAKQAGEAGDKFAQLNKETSTFYEHAAQGGLASTWADVLGTVAHGANEAADGFDVMSAAVEDGTATILRNSDALAAWLNLAADAMGRLGGSGAWSGGGGGWGGGGGAGTGGFSTGSQPSALAGPSQPAFGEAASISATQLSAFGEAASIQAMQQDGATRSYLNRMDELSHMDDALRAHARTWDSLAGRIEAATNRVAGFESELGNLGSQGNQVNQELNSLVADRTLRRQLGLPELPGETATIGDLYRRHYGNELQTGAMTQAEYNAQRAREAAGGSFYDVLSVADQHVQAQNVIVQTSGDVGVQGGAGGTMSSISGSGLPTGGLGSDRFQGARSSGPQYDPRTMGIGRAIG